LAGSATTFGPADPHCPRCDAGFATEHHNARYGYVSVCMFCLAEDLATSRTSSVTRPRGTERFSPRKGEDIAARRATRLAEARERIKPVEAHTNDEGATNEG
jgi:hypothetical protein